MRKAQSIAQTLLIFLFLSSLSLQAKPLSVTIAKANLVGNNIVMFVPEGFNQEQSPSLMLDHAPKEQGNMPAQWKLIPHYALNGRKASASLSFPQGTSLYGGGEVTGTLLRNGKKIKLWNTDNGAYYLDKGSRLYQTHPWIMGVRPDGTAFGVLFESIWKATLSSDATKISYASEGALFRTFVIDRATPQEVMKGLAALIGTMPLPPRWALGYHQCRFSYLSDTRVKEIADTFRLKNIPCDVIWMDINYMDGFRVFTFDKKNFPDPLQLNNYLHDKDFHSIYMIDPGVKFDTNYSVYQSGHKDGLFMKDLQGNEYHQQVWPGDCAFPDFTRPETRTWWAGLYKNFMALGIDGVWNDMNEPAIFNTRNHTMSPDLIHLGGGGLPTGTHLMYHNAYGRLMVEATRAGILEANPDKRPFVLTRSNLIGGQRYAATWTGDNVASYAHMKLAVPMSLTLGLSGQPFNGPDVGGFIHNTSPDLWANWLSAGAFFPFVRGHACEGTNNKEPWAYGKEVENSSRIALERRYRLLPYLYTLFYESSLTGMPVMQALFFANPKNLALRGEEQAFMLGSQLIVIPSWAKNPTLPSGIWETMSLVDGDHGKYQATLKIKGGAIIPAGKLIQNTKQNSIDPLTLIVCLDAKGEASGQLYWDAGDGWAYKNGDYSLNVFHAIKQGNEVKVSIQSTTGSYSLNLTNTHVELLYKGKCYKSLGDLTKGITVSL